MTFHGFGTILYGQRDYWPDGSFITTEWFAVACIPIFPMISKRIAYVYISPMMPYNPEGYRLHGKTAPNLKQVVCIYGWFASMLALVAIYDGYRGILAKTFHNTDIVAIIWLLSLSIMSVVPYLLRRWAKWRRWKEWEREKLGLSPPIN